MLFNSLSYALFLPLVFLFYWFVCSKNLKLQNAFLLLVSYYFYSCWDWRFLFLLFFSTYLDFFTGLQMQNAKSEPTRKFWFWLSIIVNLGFLGVFKYYNFFADNFKVLLESFGTHVDVWTLKIILPVGISFYTFHGLSYVVDIYKKRIRAEENFVDYAVFVSFFALLVAGPIERATHLLPQIKKKRVFDYHEAVLGLRQILWGLFKKVVIADQCSQFANQIFNDPAHCNGSTLFVGVLMFTFQIYGDFSGYSDIALGSARLFGINLLRNFAYPYFSRDIAEFWRRWHISLSSWFRDYLYIPLGGSKVGTWKKIRNTFIIFIVSGFWHGANWTFIVWGALNALFILPSTILKTNRNNLDIIAQGKWFPTVRELIGLIVTFLLTNLAWVFFRAKDVSEALFILKGIASTSLFELPTVLPMIVFVLIAFMLIIEWFGREHDFALRVIKPDFIVLKYSFYMLLIACIFLFSTKEQQFIYFQF